MGFDCIGLCVSVRFVFHLHLMIPFPFPCSQCVDFRGVTTLFFPYCPLAAQEGYCCAALYLLCDVGLVCKLPPHLDFFRFAENISVGFYFQWVMGMCSFASRFIRTFFPSCRTILSLTRVCTRCLPIHFCYFMI